MLENLDDRVWLEPPDYETNAIFKCDYCYEGIYEGDSYYEIEGEVYCKDCLDDNFMKYATSDE